jgi:hypothetical protein
VKEEIFRNLVAEFRVTGPNLRLLRQAVMQRKFARHYRRMLPALLETLQFRSNNRFQPLSKHLPSSNPIYAATNAIFRRSFLSKV